MNKYFYRVAYTALGSRKNKARAIKLCEFLKIPAYRVGIDINNTCNLKCIMCYMSFLSPQRQIMSLELFIKIAEQIFPKTKFLDLSCSFEPFMVNNFIEYARHARKHCPGEISLCTNGLLMNKDIITKIVKEKLLDEINISCDGLTEKTYNSIRINGDFKKLLMVLQTIKEERDRLNTKIPVIRLNYTMLKRNLEELEGIYDFTKYFNINCLQLRHAKLTNPFSSLFDESLYFHQNLSDKILTGVIKKFSKDSTKTLIHPPLFSSQQEFISRKNTCAYPWFNFIINSKGNLNMCNIGVIGDFKTHTLNQILASKFVQQVKYDLLQGKTNKMCDQCYTVSDLESVQDETTFIRKDLEISDNIN